MIETQVKYYFYDMNDAYKSGELEHPQIVIRRFCPDATNLEPRSIGDRWVFMSPEIDNPPSFISEIERNQTGYDT